MGYWPVVKKVLKDSDIVLLVLDVRMPEFSRNETLERMIERYGKKKVLVFTRRDIVSKKYLDRIRRRYEDAFFVSGVKNIGISKLKRNLLIMAKRMKIKKPKIGIVGYPNVGKSAVINALAKGSRAKVSNVPGTTKGIQWIKAGGLLVLDSPGVVPFGDSELKLGILGSKDPEKLKNVEKVAYKILVLILDYDRSILERNYGVSVSSEDEMGEDLLEKIGREKGFLLKGGVVDERRAAVKVIRDWQKGKLGL